MARASLADEFSLVPGTDASRKRWTLIATIIASSMTFIDGTVINVALPALQTGLDATITDVQWVIEAYALFLGALILVGGSLGDQLGRKRVFIVGVVSFTAASVLCGFAPSPLVLVVGRALQGIGAAFLVPGSLAIISATFDGEDRGRAIGTWSGFSAITTAIGPVMGGWLVEHVSWRAVFFINIPLAAIVLLLSFSFMDESKDASRDHQSLDWTGAALAVVGLSGLTLGLLEWPPLGATHPIVISALVVGAVSFVLLFVVEARATNPMLPLTLFHSRAFTLANVLTLFLYAALGEMMFLLPMDLIQVHRYSPTAAGASLLPFPLIIFALSRWSGGLVSRVSRRIPLSIGPFLGGVGFLLLGLQIGDSFWTTFFPGIVVLGFGMAVTIAPLTTTVMDSADKEHSGAASGINNAVSRVAGLLAIAGFGVMIARTFEPQVLSRLQQRPLSAEAKAAVQSELPKMAGIQVDSIAALPPDRRAEVRDAVDGAFTAAFRLAMFGGALLAVAAAAVGFATPDEGAGKPGKADPSRSLS